MTGQASAIPFVSSTDQAVARASSRSQVAEIMGRARSWFQHKPSVELAQIIGCDVRTAERYFAGDRTPEAAAIVAILKSEVGVKLVEAAVADLPAHEQEKFWRAMGDAALRAFVRANNEAQR